MHGFKTLYFWCILVLSTALLAGCADTAATQTLALSTNGAAGVDTSAGGECGSPADAETLAARVIELVNQERGRIGVPTLQESETLRRIAGEYACRMIEEGFFSHYTPDGDGPGERAIRGGYVFMKLGENLGAGQTTAEQAVAEWMASELGHRENILSPEWTEIGVAVRVGGEHGIYWVQEFGYPPGR